MNAQAGADALQDPNARLAQNALLAYDGLEGAEVVPLGEGLINQTYAVDGGSGRFVLQQVAGIFDPRIHENIRAVTTHLQRRGMATPLLVPTRGGLLYTTLDDESVWRLQTYVPGTVHQTMPSARHAETAGALVGAFHAAMDALEHDFLAVRTGVHDTAQHMHALTKALRERHDHALHAQVAPLAEGLLEAAERLPPLRADRLRTCHGDLKISNIMFDDGAAHSAAICLIDLDTLGPQLLAHELGDAWRSWCNLGGEERGGRASIDLDVFDASWRGYQRGSGARLDSGTLEALLAGPEWISLELAARFAADVLNESYFGWDSSRFSRAGEHNLMRAYSQWSLHGAFVRTRDERARILDR